MEKRKMTAGFTLVELIVAIAILGILAGVGTVGYSGYIKKANMAADQQLISGVENATALQNYMEKFPTGAVGYVILTQDQDVVAQDSVGTSFLNDALAASYGSDYTSALRLQYNGWTDTATMLNLAKNQYASSVGASTYITNVGTEVLLGDVQNCASSLAKFLDSSGWSGEESAKALNELLGGNASEVPEALKNYEGEITADVLANATVFGLADSLSDSATSSGVITNFQNGTYLLQNWESGGSSYGVEYNPLNYVTDTNEILTETSHTYAALEAFVGYMDLAATDEILEKLNSDIAAASSSGNYMNILNLVSTACGDVMNTAASTDQDKALTYFNSNMGKTDGEAYIGIMQTVDNLNGDYTSSLGTSNLFGTSEMADRVNSFVAAASLSDLLGDSVEGHDLLNDVASGNYGSAVVMVFTANDNGVLNCVICPGEAKPAG